MASIICYSAPITIRACSGSGSLKNQNPNRKKSLSWWAPLFGVSDDPDYLNIESSTVRLDSNPGKVDTSGSGHDSVQKFRRGCLTEEKAKQLRRKIAEASAFHDVMYHSAIASRLASDISGRVED